MIILSLNIKKRLNLFFLALLCVFFFSIDIQAQRGEKISVVVIDAGHGGKDPGALGRKSKEKDITLEIALKTGNYIKKNCLDVKVIYTRDEDVFVSLNERTAIANRNNADVFISIHCNSAPKSPNVRGVETFVMGEHRNTANLEVAKLENAAILYEDDADVQYDGFDPNSTEAYIAFSFIQSEYKQLSINLAERIQNQFVERVGRRDRGVQQAGFLVLYRTGMPSVLAEVGFLSNSDEEKFLNSDDGQSYLASAIFRAFRDFKVAYDKDNEVIEKKSDNNDEVVYKVQFDTQYKIVENPQKRYKDLKDVDYYEHNGLFKYTSGHFSSKTEADEYQKVVKSKGYKDAFVVKFVRGVRVE